MKKANITEIFSSIQGEGLYAGVEQVFVRFAGCNMACVWCDTPLKKAQGKEYCVKEVAQKIKKLNTGCHSVSLTGGEPLLYKDFIKDLAPLIKKMKLKVYLETNGILYKELKDIIKDVDIVAMDFKLPSSTKEKPYWKEHEEFLKIAWCKEVFVKAVVSKETKREDIQKALKIIHLIDPRTVFILQPNFKDQRFSVKKCLQYQEMCQKELTDVRIIPQMHKFLNIR